MGNQEYGPPPSGAPQGDQPRGGAYPPAPPLWQARVGAPLAPASGLTPIGPVRAISARNWMGTLAFTVALVGAGPVGVVLAILGIRAANKGLATNRGLAITALVLNVAVTAIVIGIVFNPGAVKGERVALDAIAIGECVNKPANWVDEATQKIDYEYVFRIACDTAHWGEVYYRGTLRGPTYPGDDESARLAEDECYSEAALANLDPAHLNELYVGMILPSEESWQNLDRTVICFASNANNSALEAWVVDS